MEYSPSADAGRSGSFVRDVRSGKNGVRRTRWVVFRSSPVYLPRSVHLHTVSDSGHHGRVMDGVERDLLFAFVATRATVTMGLLGVCSDLRPERIDQEPDRLGVSVWRNFPLPPDHEEPAAHPEAQAAFEHAGVSGDCGTVARAGGNSQSNPSHERRNGQRLLVVLLRQRAIFAISGEA